MYYYMRLHYFEIQTGAICHLPLRRSEKLIDLFHVEGKKLDIRLFPTEKYRVITFRSNFTHAEFHFSLQNDMLCTSL